MKKLLVRLLWVIVATTSVQRFCVAQISAGPVPAGIGVNEHSWGETLSVMQNMYGIGIRYVRTDLTWSTIETSPGHYDFSAYDPFVTNATNAGLKVMFILDYSNSLYDGGYSPY